jgi:hypothetical protein
MNIEWDLIEHIALIAIIVNTLWQTLDIIVYKTIIHKEWKNDKSKELKIAQLEEYKEEE